MSRRTQSLETDTGGSERWVPRERASTAECLPHSPCVDDNEQHRPQLRRRNSSLSNVLRAGRSIMHNMLGSPLPTTAAATAEAATISPTCRAKEAMRKVSLRKVSLHSFSLSDSVVVDDDDDDDVVEEAEIIAAEELLKAESLKAGCHRTRSWLEDEDLHRGLLALMQT
jgi:hypothetical protein